MERRESADEVHMKDGDGLPGYADGRSKEAAVTVQDESFLTRNGLNLTSFKKRNYGVGLVELDRPMKQRHLHMIAIGGSIGAGFFVGSGSALSKGVSVFWSLLLGERSSELILAGAGPRHSPVGFCYRQRHDFQRRYVKIHDPRWDTSEAAANRKVSVRPR